MELSPGWVTAAAASTSLVGGVLIRWVDSSIKSVRTTQKLLFEKSDIAARELQEYKLHVAETYVNQAALEKMLRPIERRLEAIENDLRGDRARP